MSAALYIGTSGWSYKHWGESFFPKDVTGTDQLVYYATKFNTVEINASFYRLPFENMVKGWHDRAPANFIFAVKGSRRITHFKKLKGVARNIDIFCNRVKHLDEHMGPVLWQLPPTMKVDAKRLDKFLARVPKVFRHAVEFRHSSWLTPDINRILAKHKTAFVSVSSMRMPMDLTVTTDFLYIRFHGLKDGGRHDYRRDELKPWAGHIRRQLAAGRPVYAYFNNDGNERAPKNAEELREMVSKGWKNR